MRRIREVLRSRVIARELGVGRSTVQGYLAGAMVAALGWPLPVDLTDQMAAKATFALKPGVWFRRGRLLIFAPVQQQSCSL